MSKPPRLGRGAVGALVWTLGISSIVLSACDNTESPIVDCAAGGCYSIPSAPESLINNLQVSYRRREVDEYAKLLAPEYVFKFQPIDANTIGKDHSTRTEDSTGTASLLKTTEVSQIRLNLSYEGRDSTMDKAPPVDSLKV